MLGSRLMFPPLLYAALATLSALWIATASADPLNPLAFASLGSSPFTAPGTYTVNTTATPPTLTPPGGTPVIVGHLSSTAIPVAVFVFDTVTIAADVTVRAAGTRPFALLSRGPLTVNGTIDVSSGATAGAGGRGSFVIGSGSSPDFFNDLAGAGGGGFGTAGGRGGSLVLDGGLGGVVNGNIRSVLEGGAGGGAGLFAAPGGPGGGAIEIGAVQSIAVGGLITANGAVGSPSAGSGGAGGGSGGALLVHGEVVTLTGTLSANGGEGGLSIVTNGSGGGGGGAGRIVVLTHSGAAGFDALNGVVSLSGGNGGTAGPNGVNGEFGAGPSAAVVDTIQPWAAASAVAGCIAIQGVPLSGATVKLQLGKGKGSTTTATTDADGCYEFDVATTGKSGTLTIQLQNLP